MCEFVYNVGEIVLREDECFWIFPSKYMPDDRHFITSPWFTCAGEKWRLAKEPYYGSLPRDYYTPCNDFIFRLWRKVRILPKKKYSAQLSLKTKLGGFRNESDGDVHSDYGSEFTFSGITRQDYFFCRNGLVKLFFKIQKKEIYNAQIEINKVSDNKTAKCNEGKETSEDEETSDDEETSEDEINSEDEGKSKKKNVSKDIQELTRNLEQVLLDEKMSDAILKVDSREFSVHKVILSARSPVFSSMFQHDLAEKKTNVVDIPDCTAEAFEVFLRYLYTGRADGISSSNVYNLYYAADKYQVEKLKKKCVKFMINNLSVETFCDIIALSLHHGESKLQKAATSCFCENIKEILKTVQWQKYMAENPTQANELLIKAHGA